MQTERWYPRRQAQQASVVLQHLRRKQSAYCRSLRSHWTITGRDSCQAGICHTYQAKQPVGEQAIAAQLISKPGLLKDTIEHHGNAESQLEIANVVEAGIGSNMVQMRRSSDTACTAYDIYKEHHDLYITDLQQSSRRRCSCRGPPRQRSSTTSIFGLRLTSTMSTKHRQNCPFFKEGERSSTKSIEYSLLSYWLGAIVDCSLTLQTGAGGHSISPRLALKGSYRPGSPVHLLIQALCDKRLYRIASSEIRPVLTQFSTQIRLIVESGQCSPHEVNEYGDNIMRVSHGTQILTSILIRI